MPDKLTDSEIVKALECAIRNDCDCNCVFLLPNKVQDVLDLINRLQANVIKEQNKNSKLRNERNRLQAQNKDLAETVHNLTIEKDALFDKVEELKAEIERLKTNLNVELENFATEYDNKIKAEAYKEFAKMLNNKGMFPHEINDDYAVGLETVNNLLKELVGD